MGHVFISYSHKDKDFALELARRLQDAGFGVWMDRLSIRPGEDWNRATEAALDQASLHMVIVSPDSLESHNVTAEWNYARGRGKPIVPVLLHPAELPPGLSTLRYIDFYRERPWEELINHLERIQREQDSDLPGQDIDSAVVIHGDARLNNGNRDDMKFEIENLVEANPVLTREIVFRAVSRYPANVSLNIPDDLYEHIRHSAATADQPLETELLKSLNVLFSAATESTQLDDELEALPSYSTGQLWAVVYRQLASNQVESLHRLVARSKQAELSQREQAELDTLLELNNGQMLLRSEALLLLQKRGSDIQTYLQMGA